MTEEDSTVLTAARQSYSEFIRKRTQAGSLSGFAPLWLCDRMKPHQTYLADWSIRKGRSADFADVGLGKSLIEEVFAENVVRHTNRPVLMLAPLAVAPQLVREGEKFGVEVYHSRDGKFPSGARIVAGSYSRLHYFRPDDFSGCVADESGCLRDADTQRTAEVTEFIREIPYRLLATATAAPNDYVELGTSSEALGELGYTDMITRFFKQETSKDHLGWGRTKYKLRRHATTDFWRWICSWARAIRKPSDLGFPDDGYDLPEMDMEEHVIESKTKRPGFLFDMPAQTMQEQQEERRRTIQERCEKVAELVKGSKSSICWCYLNPEGDLLEKIIPGAVQVAGRHSEEEKEERLLAFANGEIPVLVSKPSIAGYGLNLQVCAHQVHFPSDSLSEFYQAIGRSRRYGQTRRVKIDIVASEGGRGVLDNLKRKWAALETMFSCLVANMNDNLQVRRSNPFTRQAEMPAWIGGRS